MSVTLIVLVLGYCPSTDLLKHLSKLLFQYHLTEGCGLLLPTNRALSSGERWEVREGVHPL